MIRPYKFSYTIIIMQLHYASDFGKVVYECIIIPTQSAGDFGKV